MSKKRIPPGRTPDGTYQGLGFESPVCNFYYTTSTSKMQEQISSILRHGRENALTLSDLQRVTGWSGRAIRRAIHRAQEIAAVADAVRKAVGV